MTIPLKPRSLRPHPADRWQDAGVEPTLSEVLSDPLIHLILRRDGLNLDDLRRAIADGQSKLRREVCLLAA